MAISNAIPANLYDIDIERAILSTIFYNPDAFGEISDLINSHDFYHKPFSDIFAAMQLCAQKNEPVELIFIKKYLGKNYDEQIIAEIYAISGLIDIRTYATELKEISVKRSLLTIAHQIPQVVNTEEKAKNAVDKVGEKIYALIENRHFGAIKESHEILNEVALEIKKQKDMPDQDLVGIDTGFKYLNQFTKGFKKEELIILAARPGMGKTAFALSLVNQVLDRGSGVVFFSLEMPAYQLMLRMLSAKTSIPLSDIMTAKLSDEQWERFTDASQEMAEKRLFVYDGGNINIHQIRTQLRQLKAKCPQIELCVIDYIGLMTSSGNFSERHLQIAEISRGLKLLAREVQIPILALAQLNRGVEARSSKRPMLSDLRESGAIEQDADTILFVYRPDVYAEQEEKERIAKAEAAGLDPGPAKFVPNKIEEKAEIIIGKNRHGENGTVDVIFQKRFTRFEDKNFATEAEIANSAPVGEVTFQA